MSIVGAFVLLAVVMMVLPSMASAIVYQPITGYVLGSDNGLGIEGATVQLWSIAGGAYVDSTTTDANGYYYFDAPVATGDYRFDVSPGPYYYYTNFWFTYDGTDPGLSLSVDPTPGIKGHVYDNYSGMPMTYVASVEDYMWNGATWELQDWYNTDENGYYAFQYPSPTWGQHLVIATTPGYPYDGTVEVLDYSGTDVIQDFYLDPGPDSYEDDDDSASARTLPLDGQETNHSLAYAGDEDWYKINVQAGKTYDVGTWDPIGCSGLDNTITLFDSDAVTEIGFNDDAGSFFATLRFTADETETLYVKVAGYSEGSVGPYAIEFREPVLAISGTVTAEESGDPLEDIYTELVYYDSVDESWYNESWGFTDENGDYAYYDVGPRTYAVGFYDFDKWGGYYQSEYYNNAPYPWEADDVVYAGSPISGIDVALTHKVPTITGNVTADSNGLPLEEISVTTYWFDGADWQELEQSWTDANGDYIVYDAEGDGNYRIGFRDESTWGGYYAPEFYDDVASLDVANDVWVDAGVTTTGIDTSLADGQPSITGTVTGADTSEPLWEIEATAYYYDDGYAAWYEWDWAYTDENGEYAFYGLRNGPGDFIYGSEAGGSIDPAAGWRVGFTDYYPWDGYYNGEYYNDVASVWDATDIYTTEGSTVTGIDAVLSVGVPDITGTVLEDGTNEPLPDIWVAAYESDGMGGWNEISGTWTELDGTYALYDLAEAGDEIFSEEDDSIDFVGDVYRVGFHDWYGDDGYYETEYWNDTADLDSANDVIVVPGSTTDGIDAALTTGVASITGNVTDADSSDPLCCIDVYAYVWDDFEGYWYDAYWGGTDENGDYSLYGLGDATVTVGFEDYDRSDGYYEPEFWEEVADHASATQIVTSAGSTVTGIDGTLVLAEPEIIGAVTDAATGEPIDGAEAWLWVKDGADWWAIDGVSGAPGGYYEFYGIDAGEYKITGSASGYSDGETLPFAHNGSQLIEQDVELDRVTPNLTGFVRNAITMAAVGDAYVELYRWNGEWDYWDYTVSGTNGSFAFGNLPAGAYQMRVWADGYLEWTSGNLIFDGATPISQNALLAIDYTPSDTNEPVYGRTRYSTAVEIAAEGFDPASDGSWPEVYDIVISSGEDRASADPLSAAGLCWAYDAPLFLVSSTSVSAEVKAAVKEITDANGNVVVHVVGGTTSVPDARFNELNAYTGGKLTKDRVLAKGSRYDLAAAIAYEMVDVTGEYPETVLVANGADATKFFDALALSPISAQNGFPILLVSYDTLPAATENAIDELWPDRVIVGGGPNTVSKNIKVYLGAERWYGSSRYTTAITIANNAIAEGWLSDRNVGVAAKLPDALTGGSLVGRMNGVLLLTKGDVLTGETGTWIKAHQATIEHCFVFGGPNSVTNAVRTAINNALK